MSEKSTVIDAADRFVQKRKLIPKLMAGDEVASVIFDRATARSLEHGVTVDLIVAALIKQIAKIADQHSWSDERKIDMLPPAWIRMVEQKRDDPDPY